MKKSFLIAALMLSAFSTQAAVPRSANARPNPIAVNAGLFASGLIQCKIVPGSEAAELKEATKAKLSSLGAKLTTYDRDYEIGFQQGIIEFTAKNAGQKANYCRLVQARYSRQPLL